MLTNEEAVYLLGLKKVLENDKDIIIESRKTRLNLVASEDKNWRFWVEMTRNDKIILKTSIHHLETNHYTGLLRVDYKGSHKNPDIITDKVPQEALPYAGAYITEPHIHIYVEGYKPLAWAIPLSDYDFEVKTLDNLHDANQLLVKFAEKINLDISQKINTKLPL